ncbi:uncharacterized protein LOC133730896 [Rosa rugosa]|uniref:uncharacterized protein LOC133730896 n=1 Tax=Rosa rugosa TaxID=74645 RepID=UPI002B4102AD|nr:uncharacterized protein LOC133730896 [Rosa rugosa]
MGWVNTHTRELFDGYYSLDITYELLLGGYYPTGINANSNYVARDLAALGLILSPQPPTDPLKVVWKTIWSAKVPGKVALNAWRIAANILPTRRNLSLKGYDGDTGCVLCSHDPEDSLHLFINCPYASDIWSKAGLQWSVNGAASMHECLLATLPRLNKEEVNKTLMLRWGIWKNRNSQVWEQKSKHASETFLITLGWYEDVKRSNASPVVRCRQGVKLVKPRAGQFKMNCDGAYIPSTRRGGVGCVSRNSEGEFLAGASRPHALLTSPFHAELLALKEGLRLAMTLQYTEITFESDCALLVQAFQQEDQDLSTMCLLIYKHASGES